MDDKNFYRSLRSFKDFSGIMNSGFFSKAPASWFVVLTDIKGSTKAIQAGRYKQVNVVGAASICSVLNRMKDYSFPYVFGGDGATLLIPPDFIEDVKKDLHGLQLVSIKDFDLELRVGVVKVQTLYDQDCQLWVGKYQLSPGNELAQFRGNGLTRAEQMIKNQEPGAELLQQNGQSQPPELLGLSCRLEPLPSKKGSMLALLVKPKAGPQSDQVLKSVLNQLREVLGGDLQSASPVSQDRLKWRWIPPTIAQEAKFLSRGSMYLLHLVQTSFVAVLGAISLRFNLPIGAFKPRKYKTELVLNSDFEKFDETLRMVLDCSPDQIQKIEIFLEKMFQEGQLNFGLHESKNAIMTCMVYSLYENQHIHFIDGANGGYALAAVNLKKQLK